MEELAKRSATQLVEAIKTKQISAVELLQYFIKRYHRFNPKINAIVATDFDAALKRADEADAALARGEDWGPLHGLPMTLKDGMFGTRIQGCSWLIQDQDLSVAHIGPSQRDLLPLSAREFYSRGKALADYLIISVR